MAHACSDPGCDHGLVDAPDVIIEGPDPDAAVAIAEIEANRDVKLAEIGTVQVDQTLAQEVAALRGELAGIRQTVATLSPALAAGDSGGQPDPVIVVDDSPEPEPVVPAPAAEPETPKPPRARKEGNAFWR